MIDPGNITTVRVGELPPANFNLTDNIPHEVGYELKKGTIQEFVNFISSVIETGTGLAFNPTTVLDGETLPITSSNEWLLVGKGTFHNVGGQADIITTEELNALTSNGSYWSLSVEIPINVEFAGVTQNIRPGYTSTTPSENVLYNKFAEVLSSFSNYTPNGGYTGSAQDLANLATSGLSEQLDFEANGVDNFIDIGTSGKAKLFFYNSVLQTKDVWEQTDNIVTFTFTPDAGAGYKNLTFI